jgi:hypothetical protein
MQRNQAMALKKKGSAMSDAPAACYALGHLRITGNGKSLTGAGLPSMGMHWHMYINAGVIVVDHRA